MILSVLSLIIGVGLVVYEVFVDRLSSPLVMLAALPLIVGAFAR